MSKTAASNWAGIIGSALIVCVCCHVGQPLIGIGGVVAIWVLWYVQVHDDGSSASGIVTRTSSSHSSSPSCEEEQEELCRITW